MNLPTSWESVTIGASLELINGRAFKPKEWSTAGRPIIRIQNLNNPQAPFNYCAKELPKKFSVAPGDLLFAWSGTPGTSFGAHIWKGPDAWLNQHIFKVIFPSDVFDRTFLQFAINQNLAQYIGVAHGGAGLAHITKGKFNASSLPLPPLAEQKRIVAKTKELFSELEAAEESLRVARRQLGVYRQSLLKQAFEGKLTEKWRTKNRTKLESTAELLARTPPPVQPRGGREASLGVIEGVAGLSVNRPSKHLPLNWEWIPLLRIARQETGHTPSRNHPEYWDGEFCWLSIPDARIHHGRSIESTSKTITQLGLDNSSARLLPRRTVCFSRTASVGYVCVLGNSMATSQDFATWTCTPALVPEFLMYAFIAEGEEIRRFGKGTTHTTIYFPEIRALHIALPPVLEQQEIVRLLDEQFEVIERNEREIDAALKRSDALRQSILKKAFTGRLVPQDPADEPASQLLARLRAVRGAGLEEPAKRTERRLATGPGT